MKKILIFTLLINTVFFISCDSPKKHWEHAIEKINNKEYIEAENILNNLIAKYPASEFVEKAKEKTAEIYWNMAIENFNNKNYIEAENILDNLMEKYPISEFAEKAKEKIAEMYWQRAIDKFNDEYYEQAQSLLDTLISKFPTSKLFDIAEKKIKEIKSKATDFCNAFEIACTYNNSKIKQYLKEKGEDKIVEALIVSGNVKEELATFNRNGLKFNEVSASYTTISMLAFEIGEKDVSYRCLYKAIGAVNDNSTKIALEVLVVNNLLEDKDKTNAIEHIKKTRELFCNEFGVDKNIATEKIIEYIESTKLAKKNMMLQLIDEIDKE